MGVKNFVLGIAIAVLTISVAIYGIHTFYPSPEFSDFCNESKGYSIIETPSECESLNGSWIDYGKQMDGNLNGYCDLNYYCSKEYQNASEKWDKKLFYIGLPLGILIILLGAFLFKLEFVGAGLMWGGVVTIIYSTWNFFFQSSQSVKFILSLMGLVLIIYLAYRYNRPKKK
jgi:hypothetical protein